MNISNI